MPDSNAAWLKAVFDKLQSIAAEDTAASGASTNLLGFEARNAQKPSASASGNLVRGQATMDGKQVVAPRAVPELTWAYAAAAGGIVSSTADVVIKAAAGAGVRNYLCGFTLEHDALGAATECVIKDGATIVWRGKLQTSLKETPAAVVFEPPIRGSANTALNFALLTSTTGGVYVNAQGFTGL